MMHMAQNEIENVQIAYCIIALNIYVTVSTKSGNYGTVLFKLIYNAL